MEYSDIKQELPLTTAAKQKLRIKFAETVGNKREANAARKKLQEAFELEEQMPSAYYEYDYYEDLQASYDFKTYQPIAELFRYRLLSNLQTVWANELAAKLAGALDKRNTAAASRRTVKKCAEAIGKQLDYTKNDIACARFIEAQLGSRSAYAFISDTHKGEDGEEASLYSAILEDVDSFLEWARDSKLADKEDMEAIRDKAREMRAYQGAHVKKTCAKIAKEYQAPLTQAGAIAEIVAKYVRELEAAAAKDMKA